MVGLAGGETLVFQFAPDPRGFNLPLAESSNRPPLLSVAPGSDAEAEIGTPRSAILLAPLFHPSVREHRSGIAISLGQVLSSAGGGWREGRGG